jgi:hypothetical protein
LVLITIYKENKMPQFNPYQNLQPATQALLKSIPSMTDTQLQGLEKHFLDAYTAFLAALPQVNGKPPADTPLLRQAASAATDLDTQAVFRAVQQRRAQLTNEAQMAAYKAQLAANSVPADVATPIVNTLKTNLGL